MSAVDRVVGAVTSHTRIAIAVMVLLTLAIGAGAGAVEQESSLGQFQSDTPELKASNYIDGNFTTGSENATSVQVIVRGDNVLSKSSLIEMLEYQQRLRADSRVSGSLINESAEQPPTVGVPNVLAQRAIFEQTNRTLTRTDSAIQRGIQTAATDTETPTRAVFDQLNSSTPIRLGDTDYGQFEAAVQAFRNATSQQERAQIAADAADEMLAEEWQALRSGSGSGEVSLDRQIQALERLNATQIDGLIGRTLDPEQNPRADQALGFMPTGGYYEPGSNTADATVILVTQQTDSPAVGGGTATQEITDAQLAMQEVADDTEGELSMVIFGSGIITDEINQSMTDSMTIVGPLALLFVLIALAVGYRDLLDIILGVVGIFAVLIWTFGFMGWLGIDFNQIFIAVPVLLIGLSIDYAIHIFMRHREERFEMGNGDLRGSMKVALSGVGIALALVTATTVIGFMSNLISPLPPIQDFGVVSSFGILAAFLIFGVLTPALKIEIDGFLENRGFDRKKRAIGTGGGRLSDGLKIGSIGAKRSAYVVIAIALVVSALGAYGATQVDTSFSNEDFLADDPPDWLKDLPEPFAPGDYRTKQNLEFVNERFQREDSQADILIRGDVAADGSLDRIKAAQTEAATSNVTLKLSGGQASVQTPLTVINETLAGTNGNSEFREVVTAADTDGDGIPEENLTRVYDALFEVNPQSAGNVLYRTESGAYEAARINVGIKGTASGSETTSEMRAVATSIEDGSELRAVATGQTILFEIVQDQLLDTVIESLLITLVAIIAFLMIVYRVTDGSATLGFVTLLPVVLSVAWILGTMYLVGIPFNVLTGMITSLTVGLGVAYSIHISERYNQELDRHESAWEALDRSVTGTGGALLGSAATTVGGFGTLAFALLPALQQFGIITGLTIIYAFLASVLVLPSLLIVWTRFVGPSEKLDVESTASQTTEVPTDD
ncbi:efflux RND transporter permease subunit [Halapricum salinum]|uniref:RND family transporter n=1 Tax=Halapricum salinum TaxID=1457250 RepID=A0A4D6HD51_9EURY|nr:MMPL family transporter [Halapricum salinum]QCC51899.1 RND family transporter [Halapricum salinum]